MGPSLLIRVHPCHPWPLLLLDPSPVSPDIQPMSTPTLPTPQSLHLPRGYRQQPANLTHDANRAEQSGSYWNDWRLDQSRRYQFHVYRWAAKLIKREGITSVLDVGCGPCTKIIDHILPVCPDVEG